MMRRNTLELHRGGEMGNMIDWSVALLLPSFGEILDRKIFINSFMLPLYSLDWSLLRREGDDSIATRGAHAWISQNWQVLGGD